MLSTSSDVANASNFYLNTDGTKFYLNSTLAGTGSYLPISFYTGGSERMRIGTTGNIGVGLSENANIRIQVKQAVDSDVGGIGFTSVDGAATSVISELNTGSMVFRNGGATRLAIDSSGNVGIGTSSAGYALTVYRGAGSSAYASFAGNASSDALIVGQDTAGLSRIFLNGASPLTFWTNGTERARIDSSGNFMVGTTSALSSAFVSFNGSVAGMLARFYNSNAAPLGIDVNYTGAAPNSTASPSLYREDTASLRMAVRSNGGIANFSANNVNLSDERTKTDIVNAGNYLDKICAIPVRTFKYKDQTDDLLNLGVIAQEVEAVAPELVDVSGFGEIPEDGVPLKAVYQTDLQYALMKCIQEQQALITQLQADVAALKGN